LVLFGEEKRRRKSEANRRYREKHKEELSEKDRKWYAKNRKKPRILLSDKEKKKRKIESQRKYAEKNYEEIKKKHVVYREKHREELKESGRKWKAEHLERSREIARNYIRNNPEKARESRRKYEKKYPEKKRAKWRRLYQNNIEKYRERARKYYYKNPEKAGKWAKENPELAKAYQKKYYKKNPPADTQEMTKYRRSHRECEWSYCEQVESLHVHHILAKHKHPNFICYCPFHHFAYHSTYSTTRNDKKHQNALHLIWFKVEKWADANKISIEDLEIELAQMFPSKVILD